MVCGAAAACGRPALGPRFRRSTRNRLSSRRSGPKSPVGGLRHGEVSARPPAENRSYGRPRPLSVRRTSSTENRFEQFAVWVLYGSSRRTQRFRGHSRLLFELCSGKHRFRDDPRRGGQRAGARRAERADRSGPDFRGSRSGSSSAGIPPVFPSPEGSLRSRRRFSIRTTPNNCSA